MFTYPRHIQSLIADFPWLWHLFASKASGQFNPNYYTIKVHNVLMRNAEPLQDIDAIDFTYGFIQNVPLHDPYRCWLHCFDTRCKDSLGEFLISIPLEKIDKTTPFVVHLIEGIRRGIGIPVECDTKESPIPEPLKIMHFCLGYGDAFVNLASLDIYRLKQKLQIPFNNLLIRAFANR